ncbi:MAG: bile acid:sodium symporter [Planctomycetes bacterium]|nr:bile acid:sodium symporter [Planctomycetota bacterium]
MSTRGVWQILAQQWFILLLLAAVAAGSAYPAPGQWADEHLSTKPFIFVLLFLTGLTFEAGELWSGLKAPRPMFLSLAGTYLLLPALLYAAALYFGLHAPLGAGLLVLGAAPTTLASAVVWTRLAGGHAALAVVLTVLSNALSVVLGPAVLYALAGESLKRPFLEIVLNLVLMVLLPIAVGQVGRRFLAAWLATQKTLLNVLPRVLICGVIVMAVSRASATATGESSLRLSDVGMLVALCAIVHALAVAGMEVGARVLGLPKEHRIAAVFIGGQKTLPVACQILETCFPALALGVLSLVVYHAVQLIFDSFLIEHYRKPSVPESAPAERGPA